MDSKLCAWEKVGKEKKIFDPGNFLRDSEDMGGGGRGGKVGSHTSPREYKKGDDDDTRFHILQREMKFEQC